MRRLDTEHFGSALDADALLQFVRVNRMGHGVLLSLPVAIVRWTIDRLRCSRHLGQLYHIDRDLYTAYRVVLFIVPLTIEIFFPLSEEILPHNHPSKEHHDAAKYRAHIFMLVCL